MFFFKQPGLPIKSLKITFFSSFSLGLCQYKSKNSGQMPVLITVGLILNLKLTSIQEAMRRSRRNSVTPTAEGRGWWPYLSPTNSWGGYDGEKVSLDIQLAEMRVFSLPVCVSVILTVCVTFCLFVSLADNL